MKFISSEFLRFIAVGGLNTLATYILYLILLSVLPYTAAYTASFVAGILMSYYLTARVVFRTRTTWRGVLRFPAVYVVQYCLGILLLYVLVERFGFSSAVAPLLVAAISVPVTFALSRALIVSTSSRRDV